MKPPLAGYKDSLPPNARAILDHVLQCSAVGTVDDIAAGLKSFVARTRVDEVIVASSMYDHDARKHSLALTMEAGKAL
jgi:alkanesulfonate monooxygenase SsuD/methylene tetrahydromethanopterin reductase-like flavin-dependent oxidoreductase (luciferase family)